MAADHDGSRKPSVEATPQPHTRRRHPNQRSILIILVPLMILMHGLGGRRRLIRPLLPQTNPWKSPRLRFKPWRFPGVNPT
eukprot:scaffold1307_cov106-Skeletonema_dohrnii-CCMP3373.AAC.1